MAITQHLDFTYALEKICLIKRSSTQYELCLKHAFDSYTELIKLLPLLDVHQGHVTSFFQSRKDNIYICYQLNHDCLLYANILSKPSYVKLKYLSNFDIIFNTKVTGYTYILHPNNLVYDDSYIPKIIYVGFCDVLDPMEQSADELLLQFKCLVLYTLNPSVKYEYLLNGAIHYISKNAFEKSIYRALSLKEILILIKNEYYIERKNHMSKYYLMSKLETKTLTNNLLIANVLVVVVILFVIYLLVHDFSTTV